MPERLKLRGIRVSSLQYEIGARKPTGTEILKYHRFPYSSSSSGLIFNEKSKKAAEANGSGPVMAVKTRL